MIKNLKPKDKKALIVGSVCLGFYLIGVLVVRPVYLKQKEIRQQIENKIFFIKKYYEILNQKTYYEEKNKVARKIDTALTRRFLDQEKPALAAAALQKILESYAQQTSIRIESSRTEKPKFMEQILSVPVELNIQSNLRNLVRFIHLIENHQKFMVLEELAIKKFNNTNPEELESRLLVLGFIQQLATKSPQKT